MSTSEQPFALGDSHGDRNEGVPAADPGPGVPESDDAPWEGAEPDVMPEPAAEQEAEADLEEEVDRRQLDPPFRAPDPGPPPAKGRE
ncbi:hypothetical protein [Ornithinicoccus halotolerans]|uniref:hypothetical protein n=1 Tax=Ornithinicoccus halotolerans TaxID=1748220 RepID=UPI001297592A|nr:hypothetical protein [Ornithinicoccus halotolerans]